LVAHAQIVPPTSQNQAAIEADLTTFAPSVLALPQAEATLRLEQLIRSYDRASRAPRTSSTCASSRPTDDRPSRWPGLAARVRQRRATR